MKPFEDTINKAQQEKIDRSKKYEERLIEYLKTQNPQIVIDLFFTSPFAMQESRQLVDIISGWRQKGRYDLLKKLFSRPRGVKKDADDMLNFNGLTVVQVDTLTSQGLSREEAFERLTSFGKLNRDKDTVKKAYYQTRKKMYQLYVEENEHFYTLTVYNARVSWNGVDLFATYRLQIPKDTTKGDEVTFKVEGVAVNDEAFQRLQATISGINRDKTGS